MTKLVLLLASLLVFTPALCKLANDEQMSMLRGFSDGLDIDADVEEVKGAAEGQILFDGYRLLASGKKEDIKKGIVTIAGVIDRFPKIIDNEGESDDDADDLYLDELSDMAKNLSNIEAFTPKDSDNITIMGVSLVEYLQEAKKAVDGGDYYEAGFQLGDAFSDVYSGTQPPIDEAVMKEVQKKADWKVGEQPEEFKQFKTMDEFSQAKMGLNETYFKKKTAQYRRLRRQGLLPKSRFADSDFPKEFDTRKKWPNCIHPIRNQGSCGSCWAFATTGVISDRICIASGGKINKIISPQHLIGCNQPENSACNGGIEARGMQFYEQFGAWQESCSPYTAKNGGPQTCPAKCHDGAAPNKFFMKQGSTRQTMAVNDIKYELMTNGPVSAGMTVYQDFQAYEGGIYRHVSGASLGGHAVRMLGWGTDEKGEQYWIIANSWGSGWAEQGTARIKFGEADINSDISFSTPDLQRTINTNQNGEDQPKEDAGGSTGGAEFGPKEEGGGEAPQPQPGPGGESGGEEPQPQPGPGGETGGEEPHPQPGPGGEAGGEEPHPQPGPGGEAGGEEPHPQPGPGGEAGGEEPHPQPGPGGEAGGEEPHPQPGPGGETGGEEPHPPVPGSGEEGGEGGHPQPGPGGETGGEHPGADPFGPSGGEGGHPFGPENGEAGQSGDSDFNPFNNGPHSGNATTTTTTTSTWRRRRHHLRRAVVKKQTNTRHH